MGLQLRDLLHHVISACDEPLKGRIMEVLEEPDEKFKQLPLDHRKQRNRNCSGSSDEHFWHNGVIRNAGSELRRDLIRNGWYKPEQRRSA